MTTESVWRRQFDQLAATLRPFVVEIEGDFHIGPGAPPSIVDTYRDMLSVGYSKGWV